MFGCGNREPLKVPGEGSSLDGMKAPPAPQLLTPEAKLQNLVRWRTVSLGNPNLFVPIFDYGPCRLLVLRSTRLLPKWLSLVTLPPASRPGWCSDNHTDEHVLNPYYVPGAVSKTQPRCVTSLTRGILQSSASIISLPRPSTSVLLASLRPSLPPRGVSVTPEHDLVSHSLPWKARIWRPSFPGLTGIKIPKWWPSLFAKGQERASEGAGGRQDVNRRGFRKIGLDTPHSLRPKQMGGGK